MARIPEPIIVDTVAHVRSLREQVHNPSHVYIRLAHGGLFRHAPNKHFEDFPFAGQPIRFTLLAAQKMREERDYLKGAVLIPCDSVEGLRISCAAA